MPKEIFPSSYVCDCGHESHFFENTVREMKRRSWKRKVYLGDSSPNEHTIVFYREDWASRTLLMIRAARSEYLSKH